MGEHDGSAACAVVPLTAGSGAAFASLRPLSELSFGDFCNMSDHRPLLCVVDVVGVDAEVAAAAADGRGVEGER